MSKEELALDLTLGIIEKLNFDGITDPATVVSSIYNDIYETIKITDK